MHSPQAQQTAEREIEFPNTETARLVCGVRDTNLRKIERRLDVSVLMRGTQLRIRGPMESVERALQVIEELQSLAHRGAPVGESEVEDFLRVGDLTGEHLPPLTGDEQALPRLRRHVVPKTPRQKDYVEGMSENTITFGVGPAGTGKTYLAMAVAVSKLLSGKISRLILTRPAVEAGEKLGFLPGSMVEKVNPYLRPLYDALQDMMDADKATRLIETGAIEVAPLAFMRGRTLNESFVILDEAQNTTSAQMKMFLTRLGYNSQAVITGDITQVDLPKDQTSGLVDAMHILKDIRGIHFTHFDRNDVVRHPLIQKIVEAYEQNAPGRPRPGSNESE